MPTCRDKPLDVCLEKLPKEEKGFNIDYVSFRLGGREETSLLVGWTPTKGGGVRDSFIVRFSKFSAQVILIGSCVAPEEKSQYKAAPATRPLGPKNMNRPTVGKRPTVTSSKLGSSTAAPKITIPTNPVQRKTDSPQKKLIDGVSPPKEQESLPGFKEQESPPKVEEQVSLPKDHDHVSLPKDHVSLPKDHVVTTQGPCVATQGPVTDEAETTR